MENGNSLLQHNPEFLNMLAGEWYLTNDAGLRQARAQAKQLCDQADVLSGTEKSQVLSQLIPGATGLQTGRHFNCDYGFQIVCRGVFTAGCYLTILDGASVETGDNVRAGDNVVIATVEHHKDPQKRLAGWQRARPVVIGSNVTIGNGVTILPGTVIEDNTVIPDGAVAGRR